MLQTMEAKYKEDLNKRLEEQRKQEAKRTARMTKMITAKVGLKHNTVELLNMTEHATNVPGTRRSQDPDQEASEKLD